MFYYTFHAVETCQVTTIFILESPRNSIRLGQTVPIFGNTVPMETFVMILTNNNNAAADFNDVLVNEEDTQEIFWELVGSDVFRRLYLFSFGIMFARCHEIYFRST